MRKVFHLDTHAPRYHRWCGMMPPQGRGKGLRSVLIILMFENVPIEMLGSVDVGGLPIVATPVPPSASKLLEYWVRRFGNSFPRIQLTPMLLVHQRRGGQLRDDVARLRQSENEEIRTLAVISRQRESGISPKQHMLVRGVFRSVLA